VLQLNIVSIDAREGGKITADRIEGFYNKMVTHITRLSRFGKFPEKFVFEVPLKLI
jgi:hypothetical protein